METKIITTKQTITTTNSNNKIVTADNKKGVMSKTENNTITETIVSFSKDELDNLLKEYFNFSDKVKIDYQTNSYGDLQQIIITEKLDN